MEGEDTAEKNKKDCPCMSLVFRMILYILSELLITPKLFQEKPKTFPLSFLCQKKKNELRDLKCQKLTNFSTWKLKPMMFKNYENKGITINKKMQSIKCQQNW